MVHALVICKKKGGARSRIERKRLHLNTGGNPVYRFHSGFSSSHKSGGLRSSLALVTKLKINYITISEVRYSVLSICAARNLSLWNVKLRRCDDRRQGICLPALSTLNSSVVLNFFLLNNHITNYF